ncbi:diguanylate cyclase [Marinomonas atlantica]|uniref:diguanylate cyclase n=1 Tax=Marinomonas atlantica TaxID=1806668 RepID=UPI000833FEF7|nr:diguanylate cyclase [Marinomonas atlantica]
MSDESLSIRRSLRARIAATVFIMVLLMLISGAFSLYYFSQLNSAVSKQSEQELPALKRLNSIQLSITRLATLSNEISNSNSPAYSRILMSQVRQQIEELQLSLKALSTGNEQVQRLTEIVAKVEPSVMNMSRSKAMLDQVEDALFARTTEALRQTIEHYKLVEQASTKVLLDGLWQDLNQLAINKHLYEQNRTLINIRKTLASLAQRDELSFQAINPLISAPKGVFELLSQKEVYRTEVLGLSTQNRILLGNVVDFGHRVYIETEDTVTLQANDISTSSERFIDVLTVMFVVQLLVAFSLIIYLNRELFRRLQALKHLVGQQKSITDDDVALFDERNELGVLVKQLQNYVDTITAQQRQIETTSHQLQTIIKHSHMKVAVFQNEWLLYSSESLNQLFAGQELSCIDDFPEAVQLCVRLSRHEIQETDKQAYFDEQNQHWYEIASNAVFWDNQQADLVCLMDVTEQVKAEQEFKRTLMVVESEAKKDPLTGLLNRKLFDTQVASFQSGEGECGYAVLLFDVDYFKQYNDQLGHLQGDNILKMVASVIKRNTPASGLAIRYGGEEFLVFIPDCLERSAVNIAQSIVEDVYNQHIPHPTSPHKYLTVSCGISVQKGAEDPVLKVFDQADKSLYKAKGSGRNCMMVWRDLHQVGSQKNLH